MSKEAKIIIGANYGDEGKGLLTRHFCLQAKKEGKSPIVVFHNGSAQRGHTVDYSNSLRHVYHHFGSGTKDGIPTYFADTFLVHPMEFHREYDELISQGITPPISFVNPNSEVITPFDMVVDRATEEWIAKQTGNREFGSCGYGTWCAIEDRLPNKSSLTIGSLAISLSLNLFRHKLETIWQSCLATLSIRGVDLAKTSFSHLLLNKDAIIENFRADVNFFLAHSRFVYNDTVFSEESKFDSFIFENGQGLGLDKNIIDDWHSTSNTGLQNPYKLLNDNVKNDLDAEVCYVTRSYLTRHGLGNLNEEVSKNDINKNIFDETNVFNEFQGNLRYGIRNDSSFENRIINDYKIAEEDPRFKQSVAITHLNEFNDDKNLLDSAKYISNNKFNVKENIS